MEILSNLASVAGIFALATFIVVSLGSAASVDLVDGAAQDALHR